MEYVISVGLAYNQADFAVKIGVGRSVITGIKNGYKDATPYYMELVANSFKPLNISWLLTGEGEMLLEEKEDKPKLIPSNPQEGIPLIPTSAMAGALQGFQELDPLALQFFNVPTFRGAEFIITIRGDSMIPRYLSGDLVACRNVPLNDIFFQWGQPYVLDTDQGTLIKRVEKSDEEGCILLVSENPKYEPFSVPISKIYHVAMIVGSIRGE